MRWCLVEWAVTADGACAPVSYTCALARMHDISVWNTMVLLGSTCTHGHQTPAELPPIACYARLLTDLCIRPADGVGRLLEPPLLLAQLLLGECARFEGNSCVHVRDVRARVYACPRAHARVFVSARACMSCVHVRTRPDGKDIVTLEHNTPPHTHTHTFSLAICSTCSLPAATLAEAAAAPPSSIPRTPPPPWPCAPSAGPAAACAGAAAPATALWGARGPALVASPDALFRPEPLLDPDDDDERRR